MSVAEIKVSKICPATAQVIQERGNFSYPTQNGPCLNFEMLEMLFQAQKMHKLTFESQVLNSEHPEHPENQNPRPSNSSEKKKHFEATAPKKAF